MRSTIYISLTIFVAFCVFMLIFIILTSRINKHIEKHRSQRTVHLTVYDKREIIFYVTRTNQFDSANSIFLIGRVSRIIFALGYISSNYNIIYIFTKTYEKSILLIGIIYKRKY